MQRAILFLTRGPYPADDSTVSVDVELSLSAWSGVLHPFLRATVTLNGGAYGAPDALTTAINTWLTNVVVNNILVGFSSGDTVLFVDPAGNQTVVYTAP